MHRLIGRLRDVLDRVVELRHDNHDAIIAAVEHDDLEEAEQFLGTQERHLLATLYSLEDTIRELDNLAEDTDGIPGDAGDGSADETDE